MRGRTQDRVAVELVDKPELVPFCTFLGNRPANTIMMDKLTPYNLGSLLALYKHKISVQRVYLGY